MKLSYKQLLKCFASVVFPEQEAPLLATISLSRCSRLDHLVTHPTAIVITFTREAGDSSLWLSDIKLSSLNVVNTPGYGRCLVQRLSQPCHGSLWEPDALSTKVWRWEHVRQIQKRKWLVQKWSSSLHSTHRVPKTQGGVQPSCLYELS